MSTDYASLLNESQLEAVTTPNQHVRIIAGAGSGKTRVLTYRIAYLIEEMRVDPSRILAVTFTNKAAREMKERVGQLVPYAADFLQVSTFHSFCARFLRMEARNIGYPASFTIFDDEDTEKLIKTIAEEMEYKKSDPIVKLAISYIGKKKTYGIYPEDIEIRHESFENEKVCLKMYMAYEAKKEAMLAFDFDDLILKTNLILTNFDLVRERWQRRFRHILIDEFQDTNDVQNKLIKLLVTPLTNLYVVGDPDQTIYTWRGANQSIILNFPELYPDYQDIILDRNYRSTNVILSAANKLIVNNKKRVHKNLYTTQEGGKPITAKRFDNADAEAEWVVRQIAQLTRGDEEGYKKIAVLYRSSYLTRPFEQEFAANRVPYRIFGGLRFYQRREVKDVLAYFRLLLNDLDNVAFERIINVPKRGIGETSIGRLHQEAEAAGVSEYQYISEPSLYRADSELPSRVWNAMAVLVTKMEETKQKLAENLEVYSTVLKDFITDLGYFTYIAEDESVDEDRVGNVNSLFDDINSFIKKNPDSTFDEYLQNVSILTSQDDMNGGNYVSLMTIHVAKGLEFDHVFIIGMNEGAFPSIRAQNESGRDGMEEERRLAYVAMTRAKKTLTMTTNSGYSFQTDSHAAPSQFFKEAGIMIPDDNRYGGSSWGRSNYSYGQKPYKKSIYDTPSSFFSDGDSISPFEEPKKEEKPAVSNDNGIHDWKVGEICHHQKFGDGKIVDIIDGTIVVVVFDSGERKTLLGHHPMLSRKFARGGEA